MSGPSGTIGDVNILATILADDGSTPEGLSYWLNVTPSGVYRIGLGNKDRSSETALEQGIKATHKWMDECLNHHATCLNNIQPSFVPTRLLVLEEGAVRIVVTAEEKISGPYAALSYCWGDGSSFPCLVAEKQARYPRGLLLSELQQGILISELPSAFQEVIHFIKNLSKSKFAIRYLWIDALCIAQGCHEEWLFESSRMEDVYSNCVICLALCRAKDPDQSCIGGCSPSVLPPFEVEGKGFFEGSDKCTIFCDGYYSDALYNQPLWHRAWPLQERLLPPRVLSFGLGELFWDCFESDNRCESFPEGIQIVSDDLTLINMDHLKRKIMPDRLNTSLCQRMWKNIVMEYSQRSLTCPEKEKLVALSAIATRWGKTMNDEYLVGHFWKMLPHSLHWAPVHIEGLKRLQAPPRRMHSFIEEKNGQGQIKVPSWSWASVDGPLDGVPYGKVMAHVKSWDLMSTKDNHQGQKVLLATLTIEAVCLEIESIDGMPYCREPTGATHRVFGRPDDSSYTIPSGTKSRHACLARSYGDLLGVILEPVEVEGKTMYSRIGSFTVDLPMVERVGALDSINGKGTDTDIDLNMEHAIFIII
ncbi:hypothetical protein MW887_001842 [Aspergillus wentii]|nr:hypothetical protein MW887_001842 [Aspergillus wentii]